MDDSVATVTIPRRLAIELLALVDAIAEEPIADNWADREISVLLGWLARVAGALTRAERDAFDLHRELWREALANGDRRLGRCRVTEQSLSDTK